MFRMMTTAAILMTLLRMMILWHQWMMIISNV
jgi:hypothetical protein